MSGESLSVCCSRLSSVGVLSAGVDLGLHLLELAKYIELKLTRSRDVLQSATLRNVPLYSETNSPAMESRNIGKAGKLLMKMVENDFKKILIFNPLTKLGKINLK